MGEGLSRLGEEVRDASFPTIDFAPLRIEERVAQTRIRRRGDVLGPQAQLELAPLRLGVIAQVGAPCEVLLSPEAELHCPPRAERQQAFAPVPAVVVGSLAGEDAEVDGRMVVVRGVVDARGLIAGQRGSGGGGEAQLQHVVPPQEALDL